MTRSPFLSLFFLFALFLSLSIINATPLGKTSVFNKIAQTTSWSSFGSNPILIGKSRVSADSITHVFLIAGQSNSVGYNTDGPTPEDQTSPNLLQLNCCNGSIELPPDKCTISQAQDPLLHVCSGVKIGMGMSFARAVNATIPQGDQILLVPSGLSGTGFIDGTWVPNGKGFVRAIGRMNRAMQIATNSVFDGIIWHQGECDAGDCAQSPFKSVATDYYLYQDLLPMVSYFRDPKVINGSGPTVPFLVGQLLPSWLYNTSHTTRLQVGTALQTVSKAIPFSAFADSDGLEGDPKMPSGLDGETVHFYASSQRILGRRYFKAYQQVKTYYP